MFVVPVEGDRIKTKDSGDLRRVSSFSSLKDEPAVYVKPGGSDNYIYFSDIVEINGVTVEYNSDSKVFDALGPLKRRFNLPQPKDSIKVKLKDVSYDDELETLEVTSLRLHSKKYGAGRGMLVITKEGEFSLGDIRDVVHRDWKERFDEARFKKYYFDYLSTGMKRKG
jgi:hypothetical protein